MKKYNTKSINDKQGTQFLKDLKECKSVQCKSGNTKAEFSISKEELKKEAMHTFIHYRMSTKIFTCGSLCMIVF